MSLHHIVTFFENMNRNDPVGGTVFVKEIEIKIEIQKSVGSLDD